jgi:hypothetical protein
MPTKEKTQFLLLFRQSELAATPSPEEMQQIFGKWMDWVATMKAEGRYLGGNRLYFTGSVIRGAAVTDGPYIEAKETLSGYMLITADSFAEAVGIGKQCPGIAWGSIVEVRTVEPLPAT